LIAVAVQFAVFVFIALLIWRIVTQGR